VKKLSSVDAQPAVIEHACDSLCDQRHCAELTAAISELGRQVHMLGVIIDELVSEFQWQNNQMAEYIRQAGDAATERPETAPNSAEAARAARTTLFA
jgi:hypothetical protein